MIGFYFEFVDIEVIDYGEGCFGVWICGLLIWCYILDGELVFLMIWCLVGIGIDVFLYVEGYCWVIEDSFEMIKNEFGFDYNEIWFWYGWYCYVLLVMFVFVMMVVICYYVNVVMFLKRMCMIIFWCWFVGLYKKFDVLWFGLFSVVLYLFILLYGCYGDECIKWLFVMYILSLECNCNVRLFFDVNVIIFYMCNDIYWLKCNVSNVVLGLGKFLYYVLIDGL